MQTRNVAALFIGSAVFIGHRKTATRRRNNENRGMFREAGRHQPAGKELGAVPPPPTTYRIF